ncbi:nuclear transport factor 2 family protein [Frankia sp. R43]|uniref:nuclear transport factor 2 family protein n=1 Tax=Frankia sp. R43 TaxID=269536 RepID=UPI0006CA139D|nr:nuclear transport factor 2 family protein [Frankia sp. R43]
MTETRPRLALGLPVGTAVNGAGEQHRIVELARAADDAGVDTLVHSDHVVMGERTDRYPFGTFGFPHHRAQVEAAGEVAVAQTYCVAHHRYRESDGTPTDPRMLVRYADRCVRGSDGGWRFARRVATARWQPTHPVTGSVLDDTAAAGEPATSG